MARNKLNITKAGDSFYTIDGMPVYAAGELAVMVLNRAPSEEYLQDLFCSLCRAKAFEDNKSDATYHVLDCGGSDRVVVIINRPLP
jgi:hypothetical protein